MILNSFLSMTDGEVITPDQASQLNLVLAKISVTDIPTDNRNQISDYLTTALNIQSIDISLIDKLEALLQSIQEAAD